MLLTMKGMYASNTATLKDSQKNVSKISVNILVKKIIAQMTSISPFMRSSAEDLLDQDFVQDKVMLSRRGARRFSLKET